VGVQVEARPTASQGRAKALRRGNGRAGRLDTGRGGGALHRHRLTFLLGIVAFGVVYSAANGVWPAFYGEMFTTRVRLSGVAIGTQIGFAVAGFAVTFAAQFAGPDGDDWRAVAVFTTVLCVPPVIAARSARETHKVPTERLGERTDLDCAQQKTVTA
jgi:MFS family permease